ncbi:MAG: hypothetical protein DWQ02_16690 [Bacteroidetes bacterium]|nr:MAG: hypothetical protein DWQ02_16690 [Bacteroidota bacterium]
MPLSGKQNTQINISISTRIPKMPLMPLISNPIIQLFLIFKEKTSTLHQISTLNFIQLLE